MRSYSDELENRVLDQVSTPRIEATLEDYRYWQTADLPDYDGEHFAIYFDDFVLTSSANGLLGKYDKGLSFISSYGTSTNKVGNITQNGSTLTYHGIYADDSSLSNDFGGVINQYSSTNGSSWYFDEEIYSAGGSYIVDLASVNASRIYFLEATEIEGSTQSASGTPVAFDIDFVVCRLRRLEHNGSTWGVTTVSYESLYAGDDKESTTITAMSYGVEDRLWLATGLTASVVYNFRTRISGVGVTLASTNLYTGIKGYRVHQNQILQRKTLVSDDTSLNDVSMGYIARGSSLYYMGLQMSVEELDRSGNLESSIDYPNSFMVSNNGWDWSVPHVLPTTTTNDNTGLLAGSTQNRPELVHKGDQTYTLYTGNSPIDITDRLQSVNINNNKSAQFVLGNYD